MGTRVRYHTLTNLFLAIAAFGLGGIAQHLFGGLVPRSSPTDGLLLYALAACLFLVALLRARSAQRLPGLPLSFRPVEVTSHRWRYVAAVLIAVTAMAAIVISLVRFGREVETAESWLLYLAAMVTFVAAAYLLSSPGGRPAQSTTRWEWIALGAILVVGLFFRLYRFADLPYGLWYDEADNGLSVRKILDSGSYPLYVTSTNLPAHFLYLIGFSFRLLGDSMHAIRAVAVLFGMLTIVAAYFCGRELFVGPQRRAMGLILAFLLAVSRWDVNWSRIGMHGVSLPFFELWVVAALLRGLRTGRLTAFAWTGVAMGLGLCFYSPFRIFPFIVGGFALVWFWKWLVGVYRAHPDWPAGRRLGHALDTWALPITFVLLGTFVAVAPVAQFALRRPDVFWDRAKRIAVFRESNVRAQPARALAVSTSKHLLMFNYRGDPNGRHNLPGAPMLDPLSGVLLVLGGLICLVGLGRPRSVLLLLWLLVSLVGGVLSTWFEAPQSLRSIGAMPAAYAIACLPLAWFAEEWRRVFPRTQERSGFPGGPLAMAAVSLLVAVAVANGMIYFYVWANDFASWAAFNPAETHMAQDVVRYQDQYDLRFDPLLTAHLATRYLAPEFPVYHHFDPATVFPLTGTGKEGVMVFIAPDTPSIREQTPSLYPAAQREAFVHQSGVGVMWKYTFSRAAIQSVQGLDARYRPLEAGRAEMLATVDPLLDVSWGESPPLAYPFEVTWTGGLLAPRYGAYTLQLEAPGPCHLVLDGKPVVSGQQMVMAQGVHSLDMLCQVNEPSTVRLSWQKPGEEALRTVPSNMLYRASWPASGLVGRFYANDDWSGEPVSVRIDRQIAYYFHFLPLARPYTVAWSGRLAVPVSGLYGFAIKAIGGASLSIDGETVIEMTEPGQFTPGEEDLVAGVHDIEVRFVDDRSHSQVHLFWRPPDGDLEHVPPEALLLPLDGAWWPVEPTP